MRILTAHNRYQLPGGEDAVFESERALLQAHGHEVLAYERRNDEIRRCGIWAKCTLPARTVWAWDSCREIRQLMDRHQPAIVHFHNTFPLISPGAYRACRASGAAVVQSLYNPRLLCPAATFYRDGSVCTDCVGRTPPWPGVLHACYRDSVTQTAVVTAMLTFHRWQHTWARDVDAYIVATHFYRQLFVEGGLPSEKIFVKPHFVMPDPGVGERQGEYAVFIGRLAEEKGIRTLLAAWQQLQEISLRIRGEGPLRGVVEQLIARTGLPIELLPRLSQAELQVLVKGARMVVWPSEGYYESFGRVVIEAFACGIPVIASRIGVAEEVVTDGKTGLHFVAGDADDLAGKVRWAWTHRREMEEMGRAARAEYKGKYTAERNYQMLMDIYNHAIQRRAAAARS